MSSYVAWIGAQADESRLADGFLKKQPARPVEKERNAQSGTAEPGPLQNLPAHNFPARPAAPPQPAWGEDPLDRNPDLWLYRERTAGLLRRYLRISLETGRVPSILGLENFFRARVTAYGATTFEDRVIFVSDVEACLKKLEAWDQQLIARVILQEHSNEEAARLLHCAKRTILRRVPEVIDLLSEIFLEAGLLMALPAKGKRTQ